MIILYKGQLFFDPIEEEWVPGAAPAWMGDATERSMVHFDGKLYIPSRKNAPANEILVIDAVTGLQITSETITLDPAVVTGGTFHMNIAAITESGDKMVFTNLAVNTQAAPLKGYVMDMDTKVVTPLFEWDNIGQEETQPPFRLGDGMDFYGDLDPGTEGYLITAAGKHALRWDFVDGVVTGGGEPTIIELKAMIPTTDPVNVGIAPQLSAVSENTFIVDGHGNVPTMYNMDGDMLTGFSGSVAPQPGLSGAKFFTFKNREFIFAASANWTKEPNNSFQLFEITGGDLSAATSIAILPEKGLGIAKNSSFAYPVNVDVQPDKVLLFMMAPNNGIAGFSMTIDAVGINSANASSTTLYPSPAKDVVNFTSTMNVVEIYNTAGQLVKSATNTNGVSVLELQGLYIVKGVDVEGKTLVQKLVVQ